MSEHHRPGFHVRPASGWVNDPNAPVHVGGRYHLFCQHNPGGVSHADVHWAHFSSADLVHWTTHPIALEPQVGGPDAEGCWSGCAVVVDDEPWLLYSGNLDGVEHQTVCLARPEPARGDRPDGPGWERWVVDPEAVLARPPEGDDLAVFRDPFAWRADDGYRMLVGAGYRDGTGAVLGYRSADLRRWEQLGPFCTASHPAFAGWYTGDAWECPHLLRRGDRGLLLISLWRAPGGPDHVLYASGALVGERLEPEKVGRLDHGPDFYAPAMTVDDTGRCVLWGWSWEARDDASVLADGWAGLLTVPRLLELGADGSARMSPVPELVALHDGVGELVDSAELEAGEERPVATDAGTSLDLEVTLGPGPAGRAWVRVLAHADGSELTEVGVDAATGEVYLSRDRSSRSGAHRGTYRMPVTPSRDGAVRLRILVDASIIEVFTADGDALTARVYPDSPQSTGMSVGADATAGTVSLRWWRMRTQGSSTAPAA